VFSEIGVIPINLLSNEYAMTIFPSVSLAAYEAMSSKW